MPIKKTKKKPQKAKAPLTFPTLEKIIRVRQYANNMKILGSSNDPWTRTD